MHNMSVEVFKTNVEDVAAARLMVQHLQERLPGSCVNFDLEDCDHILRVEGSAMCSKTVIALLNEQGYFCEVLPG